MKKIIVLNCFCLFIFFIFGIYTGVYYSKYKSESIAKIQKMQNKQIIKNQDEINKILTEKCINPIDKSEEICLIGQYQTVNIRNCMQEAAKKWDAEIEEKLKLLKQAMPEEDFELIRENQNEWKNQSKLDHEIITKFIFLKTGTMFQILADDYHRNITKNRALFLDNIYSVISDSE